MTRLDYTEITTARNGDSASDLHVPISMAARGECALLIEQQIYEANLTTDGPWLFIAHHLPKDSNTFFEWGVCRPVTKPVEYVGSIELCHLEPIIVAARLHQGSLRTLFTQGYAPLVTEIEMSRHDFSGESREVYHDWRDPGAPFQQIEMQFGLSR